MKYITSISILFFLLLFSLSASAQGSKDTSKANLRKVYLGPGIGISYGAYGVQTNYLVANRFRLAAGYGANGYDMVWNLGLYIKLHNFKRFSPTISYMYGYQNYINLKEVSVFNKAYTGSSFGIGTEVWNKKKTNFLHFQLIKPVFSTDLENALRELDTVYNIQPNISDFIYSVGLHFGIGK